MRQSPNVGRYVHDLLTEFSDPVEDFGARIGHTFPESVELHRQQSKALIDVVVKISRNATTFPLLCLDQPGRHLVLGGR